MAWKRKKIVLILFSLVFILFIILSKLAGSDRISQFFTFPALIGLFIIFIFFLLTRCVKEKRKKLFFIFLVALIFKIGFMLLANNFISFPDEMVYDDYSWRQAESWQQDDSFKLSEFRYTQGVHAYYYFVAAIYYLFGHSMIIAKLFNIFLSLLSGLIIFLIMQEILKNETISTFSSILVLFFPSISVWTFSLLRDGFNLFFITLLFYLATKFRKTIKIRYLLFLLPCIWVLFNTRAHITAILLFSLIIYLVIAYIKNNPIRISFFLIFTSVLSIIFILFANFNYFPLDLTKVAFTPDGIDSYRRHIASRGESSFLENADISTFGKILKFLPSGLTYFFFSPFPWDLSNIKRIILLPDTLLWYSILPFILLGIVSTIKKRKIFEFSHIIMFCGLVTILYSLIDANMGLLHRHRIQSTYFLLAFGGIGLNYFRLFLKTRKR